MEAVTGGKMSGKGRVPCLARRGGLDLKGKELEAGLWSLSGH